MHGWVLGSMQPEAAVTSPMQELLTEALAANWTPAQAAVLERTDVVESVAQAVQRVASRLPQVVILVLCFVYADGVLSHTAKL